MPPVTADRSPPASRITGADSPVIADSSTLATPSAISPSPRDHLASLNANDVAGAQAAGVDGLCLSTRQTRAAVVSASPSASVAACALPRPSAIASAKVGEQDGEPEPEGNLAGEKWIACSPWSSLEAARRW